MRQSRTVPGFSLIEIMAVVLIMGLVMSLVVVNVMDRVEWARVETTRLKMRSLDGALAMFQIEKRIYPETDPGLTALLPGEATQNGYIRDEEALEDAWERDFEYESPGSRDRRGYDLWSWGRDGEGGGEGSDADIVSWNETRKRR